MVICPLDTPGVKIERMLPVFHHYDEPSGHGEFSFTDVRLPFDQRDPRHRTRLRDRTGSTRTGTRASLHARDRRGGARVVAAVQRAASRVAFGKAACELGGNADIIANLRMAIEQARLLTLKTAWTLDTHGTKAAMSLISQIKVMVPNVAQQAAPMQRSRFTAPPACRMIFRLTQLFAYARVLRLADGPDEVHRGVIAKWKCQSTSQQGVRGADERLSGSGTRAAR
jgi:acyl-CoA dehydrogenase